jgi:1-phosphatidylinositol-4-phosphate 5-kinase
VFCCCVGKGSTHTPAHLMRDFKFKDYQSIIFKNIRSLFHIDSADYLLCLCGQFQYLEFISNSKSGQFFFYTHDRKFMIKTISNEECKLMKAILPAYYQHIKNNPNTLLTRFYGMHRVKPHKKKQVHFLIMGSVFYTTKFVHKVFDLKVKDEHKI